MKRILSFLLALTLVFSMVPNVFAETLTEGYYYYTISEGEATITAFSGGGNITIPSSLGGYPVTTIGDYAFDRCDYLYSVTIPDSVTTIGYGAFFACNSLQSITIGSGVTTIGDSAFCDCSSVTSVTLGNGVKTIGKSAFLRCRNLTELIIPIGVTAIGDRAFLGCNKLNDINIPDSVTTIGGAAFYGCDKLIDVHIPDSVVFIGEQAFGSCDGLNGIWVDENSTAYCNNEQGILFDKDKAILIQAPGMLTGTYAIPDGVTAIGNYAFYDCSRLICVTFPDSVTNIGAYAFAATGLTSLNIPDSVTTIGESAFAGCKKLTNVIIPSGVTTIGQGVFNNCSNLANVTIPDSVTSIGLVAFYNCTSLTSITIPNGVTSIGYRAFKNCTNLTSANIPDSVTEIGEEAFDSGTNLTIYGANGSYAQQYAEANGIPFIVLKNDEARNGETTFATLQEALDAYEGGTIQLQADVDSVTVSKNVVVDLNGFDIASVKMTSATLKVLDSKTDDYTIADGDYGKIAFFIGGTVTPAEGYIAIGELDGVAYHKVSLEITDMTLRSADAGVYYKCTFNGDEMVAEQVTSYGVALSVRGTPTIGTLGPQYSAFTEFTSGANTPSTLLKNVMKETNTVSQNNRNADMKVYGRPYIQIGERYIYGETVSWNFREQVELADAMWSTFTTEQQTAVLTMYRTFQEAMDTWTIPNIKASV